MKKKKNHVCPSKRDGININGFIIFVLVLSYNFNGREDLSVHWRGLKSTTISRIATKVEVFKWK